MAFADQANLAVSLNLTGNFDKGVASASKSLGTLDKNTAKVSKSVGLMNKLFGESGKRTAGLRDSILTGVGLGGGVAAFQLVTGAITGTINALSDAVHAAAEEDAAIAQLSRSIAENDESWNRNIDAIEGVIAARQDLAFSDDEQRDSLRSLVAVTQDVGKALEVQRTAMDLARLKGIDLATATTLLGKVYGGNIGILARYGITVRKGATATEALAEIQKRAQGQAETYANTTQGKLVRSQIAAANASEDLGRALLPLQDIFTEVTTGGIRLFTDALNVLTGAGNTGKMGQFVEALHATEDAMRGVTIATKEQAGEWEGTGTVLDSFVDGLNELNNSAPTVRFLNDMTAELLPMATALGETEDSLRTNIQEMRNMGLTADQIRTNVRLLFDAVGESDREFQRGRSAIQAWNADVDKAADTVPALGSNVWEVARQVHRGMDRIEKDFAELPDSLRDTIKDGRAEVRQAMTDLRFAMEHPFAGGRYKRFLENKQQEAMKAMQRALHQGKLDAADEAGQIVLAIQGKLSALNDQKYSVNVRTVVSGIGGGLADWIEGLGRKRDTGPHATGGVMYPGDYGTVGERGMERVSNRGGVTVIEPMGGRSMAQTINVTVRPLIPAYEVNRELGRIGTTRRSGAGVL